MAPGAGSEWRPGLKQGQRRGVWGVGLTLFDLSGSAWVQALPQGGGVSVCGNVLTAWCVEVQKQEAKRARGPWRRRWGGCGGFLLHG